MLNNISVNKIKIVCGVLCVLMSCNSNATYQEGAINSQGGIGRTSSYESINSFNAHDVINERIPGPDSLSGAIVPPLLLSSYQTVTANSNGTVSLSNSSRVEWSAKLDNDAFVSSGMCADAEHNVYCAGNDGNIYSYSREGKRQFKTRFTDSTNIICTDILALTNGVVLADGKGLFSKIGFDGKLLWQYQASLPTLQTFSADANGSLYIALTHNDYTTGDTIVKVNAAGKNEWKIALPLMRIVVAPIFSNGRILVGVIENGNIPLLVECSADGRLVRKIQMRATPRGISISKNGTVYGVGYNAGLGEPQSVIQAFAPDGREVWFLNFGCKIASPALLSVENIALVGTKGSAIAVYLLHLHGVLDRFLSLETAPPLLLKPAISPDGTLVFAGNTSGCLTRVGSKKGLLPF